MQVDLRVRDRGYSPDRDGQRSGVPWYVGSTGLCFTTDLEDEVYTLGSQVGCQELWWVEWDGWTRRVGRVDSPSGVRVDSLSGVGVDSKVGSGWTVRVGSTYGWKVWRLFVVYTRRTDSRRPFPESGRTHPTWSVQTVPVTVGFR